MDFIVALPKSEGFESIMVVVDRFSKYATFIPAPADCKVDKAARLFFKNVVKLWGFPRLLFEEPNITDGLGWTFISDQQKGFIKSISTLTPFVEHHNCARDVYYNWKKEFKGQALKNIFWRAARSTYEASLNEALNELSCQGMKFYKVYISDIPKYDMINNNVAETFNGYIIKARGRPIIDMLEGIRAALIERQHNKLMGMSGITNSICPRIRAKLETNKYNSRLCISKPPVGDKFQVAVGDDQFVVDLKKCTCSCRSWDITGIPCMHACSSIHFMKRGITDFFDAYFSVQKYTESYSYPLESINGKKMWPAATGAPI
ncbi:uncharacterized protein LOC107261060 [Ricinus communis]|uniref:uncharacterized protein LOC107261060 n=1 Tax=Ricinus communis TaxID=3988 RepID=UPI00201A26A0|nr:uncharacterized protein LOC107261060 [Ricinus communis]